MREDLIGINLSDISQLANQHIPAGHVDWSVVSVADRLVAVGIGGMVGLVNFYTLSGVSVSAWLLAYDVVLLGMMLANYQHFDRSNFGLGL